MQVIRQKDQMSSQMQSSIDPKVKTLGAFKINPLMFIYIPILIATPLYTYHMAVKHKQQKPYPAATITQTACHYPQDIVFRYTMSIASSIIALSFFIIFRWLQKQCIRVGYKPLSKWYYYVTLFSMICYSITIGTIDQKGTGPLHSPCAVTFFVIWFIVIVKISVFMNHLRKWDTTVMSRSSLIIKNIVATYVVIVWIYCLWGLIKYSNDQNSKKSDQFVVIVEWNSVLVNLLWVFSFVFQWRELNFCLDFYPKSQTKAKQSQSIQQSINYQRLTQIPVYNYQNKKVYFDATTQ